MQKTKNNSSNFWLDNEVNYDVLTGESIKHGRDYVKMAATKRAIGNFVSIVTGKSIPVVYSSKDESFTDGKQVVISGNIKDQDFDPTVGLALHEGSHCLLTDFDVLKDLIQNPLSVIPAEVYENIRNKHFANYNDYTKSEIEFLVCNYISNHVKSLLNYVEDRRIDSFVYKSAPGYQGYYQAMYNKYFNSKIVEKGLQSSEMRDLDWDSYMFRIINLTNINRDINALPGLKDIWKLLDLKNVDRIKNTKQALDLAIQIFSIVELSIPAISKKETEEEQEDGNGDKEKTQDGNGDKEKTQETSDYDELTSSQKHQLEIQVQKQLDFNNNDVKKTTMSKSDKKKTAAMQDSESELKTVGDGVVKNYYKERGTGTKCLVVKNVTSALIDSGVYETLSSHYGYNRQGNIEAVDKGIRLGTMLGRKLQIRNDSNSLIYNRLRKGRLDKRMVASLGFGNEQVFNQMHVDKFSPAIVHISIDASGSMSGEKWRQSQTSAVAIAKAASMVQNLNVVISYRSTEQIGSENLPAIFVAYDSRKDKITKITKLFKHINCPGTTPEGLCFEAIQSLIVDGNGGQDSYFINFSDGEPFFENKDIKYSGDGAFKHTKKQIESMRSRGIKILSYFISSGSGSCRMVSFKEMYGKDAENIDVTKLSELTKTLNKTFATKE